MAAFCKGVCEVKVFLLFHSTTITIGNSMHQHSFFLKKRKEKFSSSQKGS